MKVYAVEITTSRWPEISRFFATIRAARRWATFCERWKPELAGTAGISAVRIRHYKAAARFFEDAP